MALFNIFTHNLGKYLRMARRGPRSDSGALPPPKEACRAQWARRIAPEGSRDMFGNFKTGASCAEAPSGRSSPATHPAAGRRVK